MTGIEERLARLEAVEEIKVLKASYFRLLDLHRWDELRALFTDDARFEIDESRSQPAGPDAFVAAVSAHLDRAMTVHHGHTPEIRVLDGVHAEGIWAMYDLVEPARESGHPLLTGFGHYEEEYRKVEGRWRIARLRLTRLKRVVDGEVRDGQDVFSPREGPG
ncbi:MAG: nuclear transport factor 2 family protein [Actinomycetota bacterium]|nr:nuclear transport factor 2 family protein [Actinomycetota bacterium]